MKRSIVVALLFCFVTLSCQMTKETVEDPVPYEEDIDLSEEVPIYEGDEATDTTVDFANIQFNPESAILLDSEISKLKEISDILLGFPKKDVLIIGHSVFTGTADGRQNLSEARAKAVADYLIGLGVKDPKQISFKGVGATDQIAPDDTFQNRARNRRVEVIIID